ncbi:hypothetical protein ACEWY4_016711 [Coilia grayii]|uniref:C2H2-type domain-containing protein n=1 Tax=Coilia grayii TaxID=363190 RepID=A0ABD1JL54_9TELE
MADSDEEHGGHWKGTIPHDRGDCDYFRVRKAHQRNYRKHRGRERSRERDRKEHRQHEKGQRQQGKGHHHHDRGHQALESGHSHHEKSKPFTPPTQDISSLPKRMRREWTDSGGGDCHRGGDLRTKQDFRGTSYPPPHPWVPPETPPRPPSHHPCMSPRFFDPPHALSASGRFPAALRSFKDFLMSLEPTVGDMEAVRRYSDYKVTLSRRQIEAFFLSHREEEWFRLRYHPKEVERWDAETHSALQKRQRVFMYLLGKGWFDNVSLDTEQAPAIIKILDAVRIMFEGGTEDDLQALEVPAQTQGRPTKTEHKDTSTKAQEDRRTLTDKTPEEGEMTAKTEEEEETSSKAQMKKDTSSKVQEEEDLPSKAEEEERRKGKERPPTGKSQILPLKQDEGQAVDPEHKPTPRVKSQADPEMAESEPPGTVSSQAKDEGALWDARDLIRLARKRKHVDEQEVRESGSASHVPPSDQSAERAAGGKRGEEEMSGVPNQEDGEEKRIGYCPLIHKSLQTQERESFKQEQRWRSVQIQMNQLWEDLEEGRRTAGDRGQRQAEPGDNQRSDDEEPQHPAGGPPALEDQPAAPRMSAAPRTPAAPRMPPADPPGASPVAWTRAAVPKLEEGDDIEQYLTTFERLAGAYRWPRADWPVYLVPYLVGRARAAYVAMDIEEAMDYDKVKEAILMKYEINEEIYRERFREPDIRPGETPRELYHRLKDLYKKWIKPAGKTVEEVGEKIILEQYLRSLAPDVRIWVKEHNPATGQQAAEWVEAFLSARRGPKTFRFQRVSRPAAGVADVCVEVGGQAYRLMAGVVKGLSHPVVLGQDVLILPELVQASKPVSMVVTRAQAKERAAETPEQVVNKTFLDLMPYSNSEFDTPKRPKVLKTRSQRRREKLLGTVQRMPVEGVGPEVQGAGLWEIPSDFASLQKDDATLKDVFNKVSEIDGVKTGVSKGLTGECHVVRGGLLYHRSEDGRMEEEREEEEEDKGEADECRKSEEGQVRGVLCKGEEIEEGRGEKRAEANRSEEEEKKRREESRKKGEEGRAEDRKKKEESQWAVLQLPRHLHKTQSLFLRSIPPTICKEEIVNLCEKYPGFLRVCLSEPHAEHRFFRRCWVTFDHLTNIQDICLELQHARLHEFKLRPVVHRELSRRVRMANGITQHRTLLQDHIRLSAKIIHSLDHRWTLWDQEQENPVLRNVSHHLVEEVSAEEEELTIHVGGASPQSEVAMERDDSLVKVLDRLLLYLRIVHSVDFYGACHHPGESEMPSCCSTIHVRGPLPPSRVPAQQVLEWQRRFEGKLSHLLCAREPLCKEEAERMGCRQPEEEVEKFLRANIRALDREKWQCVLCEKKFKGPDFVRKHILIRHGEKEEEVRNEAIFFNNFLMDSKRPALPAVKFPPPGPARPEHGPGLQFSPQCVGGFSQPSPPFIDYEGGPFPQNNYGGDRGHFGWGRGGSERMPQCRRPRKFRYRDLDAPEEDFF